jgi:hypothetical protein
MRQAIHIFRKDVRHCWPYIAAVTALTTVTAGQACLATTDPLEPLFDPTFVSLLLVLAWWLTIGAAVHDESLVGERQFWTTRPYSGKSLLTAKLLVVAVFVSLPIFLSDCVVFLANGYNPLSLWPTLLLRQCWLLGFLILPFIAAALTRLTRDLAFTGLAFYAGFFIAMYAFVLSFKQGLGTTASGQPSWAWQVTPWLIPALGLCLIVWHYARRRTVLVPALTIGLAGLAPFAMVPQFLRMASVAANTSLQAGPGYPGISLQSASPRHANRSNADTLTARLIDIPVRVGGWPRNQMECRNAQLTVTAIEPGPAVPLWELNDFNKCITTSAGDNAESIQFSIDSPATHIPDRVNLRMSVTLDILERQTKVDLWPGRGWTSVPGFGQVTWLDDSNSARHLLWYVPLLPGERRRTYDVGYATSQSVPETSSIVSGSNYPASPILFQVTPINWQSGALSLPSPSSPPLAFTAQRRLATVHRELNLSNVRLADYLASDQR